MRTWILIPLLTLAMIYSPALCGSASAQEAATETVPIVTADWEAESGDRWTIPWGVQISKVTHFGSRPVNLLFGYYHNSEHPEGSAGK